jgi:hypothetical protein
VVDVVVAVEMVTPPVLPPEEEPEAPPVPPVVVDDSTLEPQPIKEAIRMQSTKLFPM